MLYVCIRRQRTMCIRHRFGTLLPGVFGSADLIGRIKDRAVVLDWKFGRNEVDVEENEQLLFYAAAAMLTK